MIRPVGWLLTAAAVTLSGCHLGVFAKRESELKSPTDIRQKISWHAGEDAVFKGPVRPGCEYYGHRPTCWRSWPGSAEAWRDTYCPGECAPGCENQGVPAEGSYTEVYAPQEEVYEGPVHSHTDDAADDAAATPEPIDAARPESESSTDPAPAVEGPGEGNIPPSQDPAPAATPEDQASWEAPLPKVIHLHPPKQPGPLFQTKPAVAVIPPPPQR